MSKGGGDGGAAQARADEQARQEKIRQGTQNINNIFDGYEKVYGDQLVDPASLVDGQTYYLADGTEYSYRKPVEATTKPYKNEPVRTSQGYVDPAVGQSNGGFGSAGAVNVPGQLYATRKSDRVNGQFDDGFYTGRRQAYLDYATPQLNDQYAEAQKQLTFALDRSGMLDSSVRAQKEAELEKLYDTNRRAVADQGLTYENQARTNVEDARAGLVQTLNATGDAEGAASAAIARSKALSAADSYSPLGQLFNTFTSGLSTQAGLERAAAYSNGAVQPAYNTGLFGAKRNSVQTAGA
jgi:hypothetical protein